MKVAIIGSGISGLTASHLLNRRHEVVLYEADRRVGGHSNTVEVDVDGNAVPVDTGFIVYNERNYAGFTSLLQELNVETSAAEMSFSVSCRQSGLEYSGRDMSGLFAQRANLASPRFLHMLSEVLRFNRQAARDLQLDVASTTLGSYLDRAGFSGLFRTHYLLPMAAAIWSAPPATIEAFPAKLFLRFFENHGLLTVNDQPQWRSVVGGSRTYVEKLIAPFRDRIRLGCRVHSVARERSHVVVRSDAGVERYDHVVLACHSDQALALLHDPTRRERAILAALPYQRNDVVLHDDVRQLPKMRRAWSAWNYAIPAAADSPPHVTYCMNLLQRLDTDKTICVTLNANEQIPAENRLAELVYHHPVYTPESQRARQRRGEINGAMRTWYCGAYWGFGFHEDGYQSAVDVAAQIDPAVEKAA